MMGLEVQARRLLGERRYAEAASAAAALAQRRDARLGPRHPDTVRTYELCAAIFAQAPSLPDAEPLLLRALADRQANLGAQSPVVAEIFDTLARAQAAVGARDRAWDSLARALAIREAALGATHPETTRTVLAQGVLLLEACRVVEAQSLLERAARLVEQVEGPASHALVEPLARLAAAAWMQGDDAGADRHRARAVSVLAADEAKDPGRLVQLLHQRAADARALGDLAAARAHTEHALEVAERRLRSGDYLLREAIKEMVWTLRGAGQAEAASALLVRVGFVERILPAGAELPATRATPRVASRPRCTPSILHPPSGAVVNAAQVVRDLQPAFRRCYQALLQQNPAAMGTVRMEAKIDADGRVSRVYAISPVATPEGIATCPMARLLEAQFAPPEGGGATVVVPVTFTSM